MNSKKYAIGVLFNGMAQGWDPVRDEEDAIKQAYEKSIEDPSVVNCIMTGESEQDEDGTIAYLVIGGNFYKPHDL